ncbi:MAG: 30S ribosome-binding factor RbfA [Pseudomonadales bacterium]|nr:30S ribosome-binding factor RbfA [Pseudomonadales bacterium]
MVGVSKRLDKISDLLRKELALLIQTEIRDPRVGMASVTAVKVSRDLAYANVYVTILGKSNADEAKEGIEALNRAGGFLRSLLARNINLRSTPKLKFIYDDSVAKGHYLSGLIDQAIALDNETGSSENQ